MHASNSKHKNVKQDFERSGITIKEWALKHGYKPRTVYAVITGQLKCTRGVSHQITVELGIKPKASPSIHFDR